MRTETIEIYKFDELSEEAKERARNWYRGNGVPTEHIYQDAEKSVQGFCDEFGVKTGSRSWLDPYTSHIDDDILNLSGQRLRTYLLNNFEGAFYERKYRGHSKDRGQEKPKPHRLIVRIAKDYKGNWYAVFRSNFKTESCCPFTGVCYDEDLLQPFKEFVKEPDSRTFEDLISEAFETLRISLENEEEFLNSDKIVDEAIEINNYEFTEDGSIY